MYLIAGLGNPTREYDKTRHNAGFSVIDVLADRYGIDVSEKKHKALCGKGVIEGQKVLLIKPQTFMNLSGESIRAAVDYYKAAPEKGQGGSLGKRQIFSEKTVDRRIET